MGEQRAGRVTQRLLQQFTPATVVVLGIAAGISKDVKLGDVVVADQVESYLQQSKIVDVTPSDREGSRRDSVDARTQEQQPLSRTIQMMRVQSLNSNCRARVTARAACQNRD